MEKTSGVAPWMATKDPLTRLTCRWHDAVRSTPGQEPGPGVEKTSGIAPWMATKDPLTRLTCRWHDAVRSTPGQEARAGGAGKPESAPGAA